MSISIIHLPKDSELSDKEIGLLPYMFYVGKAMSNLEESIFYHNLPHQQYKQWLQQEINAKTDVYKALTSIKYIVLAEKDIAFLCSCPANHPIDCKAVTIKRAILYLLAEDSAFGTLFGTLND
jgi:hypothetical protein